MHRSKGAGLCITQEDRNAIRRLYPEQNPWRPTDQRVAVNVVAQHAGFWLRFLLGLDHAHVGAVSLPATGQRPVTFEEFEKASTILVNVLRVVFVEAGEVQRVFRHRADTAESG